MFADSAERFIQFWHSWLNKKLVEKVKNFEKKIKGGESYRKLLQNINFHVLMHSN